MSIPKKIKDGYFTYKIEQMPEEECSNFLGDFIRDDYKIRIDFNKHKDCVKDTLLHEMIHMWLCGLGLPPEMEEHVCQNLPHRMINTLKTNPQIKKFIFED